MELNQEEYLESILSPMGNHSIIMSILSLEKKIQYKKRNKSKTAKW